jgi:DDE superfamily endonuclease
MYHTTGLTKAPITELCTKIEAREIKPGMRPWPPILGLRNALTVTLTYMRRNRVQEEIAEDYGVSQPTISRAISAITPLLVQALLEYVPAAGDLDGGRQFIVDGMLPRWSWAAAKTGTPEAQDHRDKSLSRLHTLRPSFMDFRPRPQETQ